MVEVIGSLNLCGMWVFIYSSLKINNVTQDMCGQIWMQVNNYFSFQMCFDELFN